VLEGQPPTGPQLCQSFLFGNTLKDLIKPGVTEENRPIKQKKNNKFVGIKIQHVQL